MSAPLWLLPALPLTGFLLLSIGGRAWRRPLTAAIGVGSVGAAALLNVLLGLELLDAPASMVAGQSLWQWFEVADLSVSVNLYLDRLALLMTFVITLVGFLIHLYAAEHMAREDGITDAGHARFFAFLNLFVAAMLVLVLADDLLLLYLGWEGVGLCSYLLIGFWYHDPANGRAARKAFIVTRAGDAALLLGLLLLFSTAGSLNIQTLLQQIAQRPPGDALASTAAGLLLAGAVGKSAQVPLQVWLPDAMAGPTPVSALIHAATMVTAGVYLIARMHGLFAHAPMVQGAVAVIGAVTLLLAASAAIAQTDIKRVLAYSTMSQVGYMFLALGVGAWTAAIFHLMTHAFFKALLFLAAGAVIQALGDERDLRRMGGLRRRLPLAFCSFLVGSAALSAVPLVTAGYYSKELILSRVWTTSGAGTWMWLAAAAGSLLTGLYSFRALFLTFFGPARAAAAPPIDGRNGAGVAAGSALLALLLLSVFAGCFDVPAWLAASQPARTGPEAASHTPSMTLLAATLSLSGILLAGWLYLGPGASARLKSDQGPLARWTQGGLGFETLYMWALVRPYLTLARVNRNDVSNRFFDALAGLALHLHKALSRIQNGRLRWYASGLSAGVFAVLLVVLL